MQAKWGWAALLLAASAPAAGQTVTAKDPDAMARLLQGKGYRAELLQGENGPYIRSGDSGLTFSIFFLNCEAKKNCKTIQFFTGFNDAGEVPLARINEWNKTKRFTRAYIDDEKDPVLEMDVDLEYGMAEQNFLENLAIWTANIAAYRDFVFKK